MKGLILFGIFVSSVAAYEIIPILKSSQEVKHDGTYHYSFETANGILNQAVGELEEVKGNYRYTSPEGQLIEVTYVAGVNGFQPYGAHIPAVPAHVERALEYIRTHPPVDDPYNRHVKKYY